MMFIDKKVANAIGIFLIVAICVVSITAVKAQTRTEYLLDKSWKFTKADVADAVQTGFDDAARESVTVPHEWAITGPFSGNNDKQNVAIEQNGDIEL